MMTTKFTCATLASIPNGFLGTAHFSADSDTVITSAGVSELPSGSYTLGRDIDGDLEIGVVLRNTLLRFPLRDSNFQDFLGLCGALNPWQPSLDALVRRSIAPIGRATEAGFFAAP